MIGPPADVAGQNRATQAIQAQADDTAQARTNKRWTPRRVRKVVTADAIPLALRIIRSSPSARGQRSPLIQVSHRTFGKLWCVDSFAALLVEWTYSERALFLRRSGGSSQRAATESVGPSPCRLGISGRSAQGRRPDPGPRRVDRPPLQTSHLAIATFVSASIPASSVLRP